MQKYKTNEHITGNKSGTKRKFNNALSHPRRKCVSRNQCWNRRRTMRCVPGMINGHALPRVDAMPPVAFRRGPDGARHDKAADGVINCEAGMLPDVSLLNGTEKKAETHQPQHGKKTQQHEPHSATSRTCHPKTIHYLQQERHLKENTVCANVPVTSSVRPAKQKHAITESK